MYKYFLLIVIVVLVFSCKSTIDKRINKDITGINEQLYDLEKKQIKDTNRLNTIESELKKISTEAENQKQEDQNQDPSAIYKDGYKLYLDQKYEEALTYFSRLTAMYKNDSVVDNALYWQAESYMKLNNTEEALKYYQLLYRYFPFSTKADYALFKTGMIYLDTKEYSRAQLAFDRLAREYPGSDLYKTALLKIKQIKSKNRRR